ncbi:MAG: diaminopimelate decarboxylase, partial [Pseudomonadales bacterium]|nr:diaminopimelate decarboxylase [Pseudomonadales bacterium]
PPVQPGDCLVISPTGAYNNTQWQQFIEYRPAIVLVHSDMQVSVIREREDLASMKDLEICPEHLQSFHLE